MQAFTGILYRQSIHTSGNTCNGVDATYDNTNNPSTGLQVVWATQDDPDGNYETY